MDSDTARKNIRALVIVKSPSLPNPWKETVPTPELKTAVKDICQNQNHGYKSSQISTTNTQNVTGHGFRYHDPQILGWGVVGSPGNIIISYNIGPTGI